MVNTIWFRFWFNKISKIFLCCVYHRPRDQRLSPYYKGSVMPTPETPQDTEQYATERLKEGLQLRPPFCREMLDSRTADEENCSPITKQLMRFRFSGTSLCNRGKLTHFLQGVLVANQQTEKNNTDQTHSCPRDWRLPASWGTNWVPSDNPHASQHYRIEGFF